MKNEQRYTERSYASQLTNSWHHTEDQNDITCLIYIRDHLFS